MQIGFLQCHLLARSSSVLHNMLDVFPIPILSKLKSSAPVSPSGIHRVAHGTSRQDSLVESLVRTDTAMFMRPFTFHIGALLCTGSLLKALACYAWSNGGGTPVTVTPGWSINMKVRFSERSGLFSVLCTAPKIFHIGKLKGTMRVG